MRSLDPSVYIEELRASERRFQDLFEFAPDAIVMADAMGVIVMVNRQAEALFGYARAELIGRTVECLMPEVGRERHVAHRQRFHASPEPRTMGAGNWELRALRKDGTTLPVEISLSPIGEDTRFVAAAIRDVSERRRAEAAMRASLGEKETLLKEIHHRVKNNLEIVVSLLMLQSDGAADEATRGLLLECVHRVRSMALIHERLYQSATLAHIDFDGHVRSLTQYLFRAYGAPPGVQLAIETMPAALNIETAVPVGLVLGELVSNALKHAFKDGAAGTLRVTLEAPPGGRYVLTVADTGPGLPPEVRGGEGARTLGLNLVHLLVKQLKGTLAIGTAGGASFRLEFGELHYAAR